MAIGDLLDDAYRWWTHDNVRMVLEAADERWWAYNRQSPTDPTLFTNRATYPLNVNRVAQAPARLTAFSPGNWWLAAVQQMLAERMTAPGPNTTNREWLDPDQPIKDGRLNRLTYKRVLDGLGGQKGAWRRKRPREIASTTAIEDTEGNECKGGERAYWASTDYTGGTWATPRQWAGTRWRCTQKGKWERDESRWVDVLDSEDGTIKERSGAEAKRYDYVQPGDYIGPWIWKEIHAWITALKIVYAGRPSTANAAPAGVPAPKRYSNYGVTNYFNDVPSRGTDRASTLANANAFLAGGANDEVLPINATRSHSSPVPAAAGVWALCVDNFGVVNVGGANRYSEFIHAFRCDMDVVINQLCPTPAQVLWYLKMNEIDTAPQPGGAGFTWDPQGAGLAGQLGSARYVTAPAAAPVITGVPPAAGAAVQTCYFNLGRSVPAMNLRAPVQRLQGDGYSSGFAAYPELALQYQFKWA